MGRSNNELAVQAFDLFRHMSGAVCLALLPHSANTVKRKGILDALAPEWNTAFGYTRAQQVQAQTVRRSIIAIEERLGAVNKQLQQLGSWVAFAQQTVALAEPRLQAFHTGDPYTPANPQVLLVQDALGAMGFSAFLNDEHGYTEHVGTVAAQVLGALKASSVLESKRWAQVRENLNIARAYALQAEPAARFPQVEDYYKSLCAACRSIAPALS